MEDVDPPAREAGKLGRRISSTSLPPLSPSSGPDGRGKEDVGSLHLQLSALGSCIPSLLPASSHGRLPSPIINP